MLELRFLEVGVVAVNEQLRVCDNGCSLPYTFSCLVALGEWWSKSADLRRFRCFCDVSNLAVLLIFFTGGEQMLRLAIDDVAFTVGEVTDMSLSIIVIELTSHTELLATSCDESAYRLRLTNLLSPPFFPVVCIEAL